MKSLFERIISYVLGGVIGVTLGFLLISFNMSLLASENHDLIVAIMGIIGVLISIVVVEYKTALVMKHNNAIRDETVALITHEMRTSLTSSGWAIGLVLQKYDTALSVDDKKLLKGVVDSMHTTVMHSVNLLDVSLLDIGKLSISLEWTKLEKVQEMFSELLEKYTLGAKGHGIELDSSVKLDGSRLVEVDMLRLRIVLENLLENAIQYTLKGKKTIHVEISNDDTHMHINVRDTGIGIPESEQPKIFSEFYRASNARKNLSTGSGIGLYTCFKYITAHRGSIRFESKEDQGTVFFVSIPLKTVADVKEFLTKI